jgi:uncharacterized protein YlaI
MENEIYSSKREVNLAMRGGARLSIACLVCGEPVVLDEQEETRLDYGLPIHSKICDKCKAAILYMRKQIQKEN